MKRRIIIALAALLVIAGGLVLLLPRGGGSPGNAAAPAAAGAYYTCPMHPQIRKERPGACPICGMTLVLRSDAPVAADGAKGPAPGAIALSSEGALLADVATAVAETKSIVRDIHAAGTIAAAEPGRKVISARFPGRIERLFVTFTGEEIRAGAPVAELYSPEAITAEQEYLLARQTYAEVKDADETAAANALALLGQSRGKLLRWGFTPQQIAALDSAGAPVTPVTVYAPVGGTVLKKNVDLQQYVAEGESMFEVADLSTVWLVADIYDEELSLLRTGSRIEVTTGAGGHAAGVVSFIAPALDPVTRTARVRAALPNPGGLLRLGMYVDAVVRVPLPPAVVVPSAAVVATGERTFVWVPARRGEYRAVRVTAGVRSGGEIQILSGIRAGDTVVVSGGYLIDAESRLRGGKEEAP